MRCVLHYADETGIPSGQGFQNLQSLPEVLIFQLFLKELFPEVFGDERLVLEFALQQEGIPEIVICTEDLLVELAWLSQ